MPDGAHRDVGVYTALKSNAPRLSPVELDAILLADEQLPFVDPASERVFVTEHLKHDDPLYASPAAIQERRKEIEDLKGHTISPIGQTRSR